jgi:hypothetical protein
MSSLQVAAIVSMWWFIDSFLTAQPEVAFFVQGAELLTAFVSEDL